MFDFQLDFGGIEGITHELASGPVRDLEIALYLDEAGALKVDLLANAERYQRDELARASATPASVAASVCRTATDADWRMPICSPSKTANCWPGLMTRHIR
jgi:enterobactin synthetase component F